MAGSKDRKREAVERFESPWWLEGDEICESCYQRYTVELECRCDDCDAPVCPHCVVTIRETREVLCLGCAKQR